MSGNTIKATCTLTLYRRSADRFI